MTVFAAQSQLSSSSGKRGGGSDGRVGVSQQASDLAMMALSIPPSGRRHATPRLAFWATCGAGGCLPHWAHAAGWLEEKKAAARVLPTSRTKPAAVACRWLVSTSGTWLQHPCPPPA